MKPIPKKKPDSKYKNTSCSPEKRVTATKFECWVARLVYELGNDTARWDVHYTRGRKSRRQVDVQYFFTEYLFLKRLAIIECKYSSNPNAQLRLDHYMEGRREKNDAQKRITDLIDDVDERRLYVGAHNAILVTNAYFTDELRSKAGDVGVQLWDRDKLEELSGSNIKGLLRGYIHKKLSLEEQIEKIKTKKYMHLRGH